MRSLNYIKTILLITLTAGCTVQFLPDINENQELLIVDGMITDQNRANTIKLSRSMPIGKPLEREPVSGAVISILDADGVTTTLTESQDGTYSTDSLEFRGRIGNSYSLSIELNNEYYETDFIEMKPVPQIDSLYYEKVALVPSSDSSYMHEGCKIYLDSWDPSNQCLFFRWDYTETWEYRIPYPVFNRICWVYRHSDGILIKNTSVYSQSRVSKYPIIFIKDNTDKLKVKYSILINQYSLSESEYDFWKKIQNISENVGSLYDITPVAIPSNVQCISNPDETVHGYFSVSAVTQKRLFIEDTFLGQPQFYGYCPSDTIFGILPVEGLNTTYWPIEDFSNEDPPMWVITEFRECADCTLKGTKVRPLFWNDNIIYNR